MRRNKTLHVIVKYFFPVAAGIETNILETHTTLKKLGWKILIHTSRNTLTQTDCLPAKEHVKNLQVKRYKWKLWGFLPKIESTAGIIALHNFNIVPHFFILLQALIMKWLKKEHAVIFLTPHGGFTPQWQDFPLFSRIIKNIYHKTIGVWLVNNSVDCVRAVSTWEKEEMISYGIKSSKIRVISNGIEDLAFHKNLQVSAKWKEKVAGYGRYIINIGRIHRIKNMETLIECLQHIPSDIQLVIAGPVGEPEYKQKLEEKAKKLGVSHRLHFAGVVRDAEKFYLIRSACMMVHMAHWESYCNVVHEGMSQGLVCIVSNTTALPLLIKNGKNGFTASPTDVKDISEKIQWVLKPENKTKVRDISTQNKKEVQSHSWSHVAQQLDAVYSKLIR